MPVGRSKRRSPTIAAVVGALVAATVWFGSAFASPGDRIAVTLPAGEDPAAWRETLAAAGLELTLQSNTARVHIEAGATRWRLVVLDGATIARELFVPAPTTDRERREVAILARALSASLPPPDEPGADDDAPAPPAWIRPPDPPPADPQPEDPPPVPPSSVAEEPLDPEPADDPPSGDEGGASDPPTPMQSEAEPDVDDEPGLDDVVFATDVRPKKRRDRWVEAPPIALVAGLVLRHRTGPAGMFGVQTDPWTVGRLRLTTEFAIQPARALGALQDEVESPIWRQYVDVRGLVGLAAQLGPHLRVGPVAGATYRTWRQQFRPVLTSIVPVAGGQGELTFGGIARVGLRAQVLYDMISTTLVDSTEATRSLPRLDVGTQVVFRIQPRRPERAEPRPAPRTLDPVDLEDLPR